MLLRPWARTATTLFPVHGGDCVNKGSEEVTLEIEHLTGAKALTPADLAMLESGSFEDLPLHVAKVPLVNKFEVHGCHHEPGRMVKQELQAGKPFPLSVELAFGRGETVGGVHTFNVIQKSAAGKVQGGLRLRAMIFSLLRSARRLIRGRTLRCAVN